MIVMSEISLAAQYYSMHYHMMDKTISVFFFPLAISIATCRTGNLGIRVNFRGQFEDDFSMS